MPYLQSFLMGLCFVAGILVATMLVLACFRGVSSKEKAESTAALLRLEVLHTAKLAELKRIADVMEAWWKKSEKEKFHGE